ncbi:MAG TPA: hypothetical protein VMY35_15075, partial [Phycisphaerae bacterium]|nr:hypothetical protein [Phycisphaerae bacterium]
MASPFSLAPMTSSPDAWRAAASRHRGRRSSYQMTPEEEESTLQWLGRGSLSGLAAFAHTVGKPGAAVRGTLSGLSGGPWGGGLLNLIPFSNTMGITDPDKWVFSRDIMRRQGLVGKKDTWGNFATGLAADVLTDPLFYVGGGAGAMGRSGQLLERMGVAKFLPDVAKNMAGAGVKAMGPRQQRMTVSLSNALKNLPEDVANEVPKLLKRAQFGTRGGTWMGDAELNALMRSDKPLGGLFGVGLPGMAKTPIGPGIPGALPLAKGMDWVGHGVRYSSPVRHAFAGFSKPMQGKIGMDAQKAIGAESRLTGFKLANMREGLAADMFELDDLGLFRHDMQGIQDGGVMRSYIEGTGQLPAHMKGAEDVLKRIRDKQPEILALEQAEGMATGQLVDDMVDYMHRQAVRFNQDLRPGAARGLDASIGAQKQRTKAFKELPTNSLNQMTVDPVVSGTASTAQPSSIMTPQVRQALIEKYTMQGMSKAAATRLVRDEYPKRSRSGVNLEEAAAHLKATYADDLAGWKDDKIERLASALSELDPQHAASGIPLFAHHPLVDQMTRMEMHIMGVENARAARGLIAEHARHISEKMPGDVSLGEALAAAGLKGENAPFKMYKELPDTVTSKFPNMNVDAKYIADSVFVPGEIAADLGRTAKAFTSPDWLKPIIKGLDNYTNFFRAHVTTYFPAFNVRNWVSGQLQNSIGGAYGPAGGDMLRALNDGNRLLQRQIIPGVLDFPVIRAANIKDPVLATRKIAELVFA